MDLAALDQFLERFRALFRRRDQARWLGVYLRGLLGRAERKSMDALARQTPLPADVEATDVSQALQNFIHQSPWDEDLLWRMLRSIVAEENAASVTVGIMDEIGFVKQGSHSVGIQRQYWGENGRKRNGQVAVALFARHGASALPVGARLYLPRTWTQDAARLDKAGVPTQFRTLTTRPQIALQLLDDALRNMPLQIVLAGSRFGRDEDFRLGLVQRRVQFLVEIDVEAKIFDAQRQATAMPLLDLKGLGRQSLKWEPGTQAEYGCLPVRLPGLAENIAPLRLLIERRGPGQLAYLLADASERFNVHQLVALWHERIQTQAAVARMNHELGADHFEGRSWRGFHHHLCLVALAHCFLTLSQFASEHARS